MFCFETEMGWLCSVPASMTEIADWIETALGRRCWSERKQADIDDSWVFLYPSVISGEVAFMVPTTEDAAKVRLRYG